MCVRTNNKLTLLHILQKGKITPKIAGKIASKRTIIRLVDKLCNFYVRAKAKVHIGSDQGLSPYPSPLLPPRVKSLPVRPVLGSVYTMTRLRLAVRCLAVTAYGTGWLDTAHCMLMLVIVRINGNIR